MQGRLLTIESVLLSTRSQLNDIMAFAFKRLLIVMVIWHFGSNKLVASTVREDFCQYEHFQPRCPKNEIIIMKNATYGRMRIGRCITAKEVEAQRLAVGDDPRYLGCSETVLSILDRKCSGKTECDVRVIDMALEDVEPCFPGLSGYLEVSYDCISIADKERSCSVTATMIPIHIIGASESQRICGTMRQPWTVEAPVGQQIRISLLDFRASTSDQISAARKQSCHNYGVIVDRTRKRNVTICGYGLHRESELYTTSGNAADILIDQLDQKQGVTNDTHFVLRLEAVGCSDLIPPEDAWLKRSDDSIVIGCYSTRQTWHLHCEAEKWIGVFGNCSQAHNPVVELENKSETWPDEQVLTLFLIGGFTLTVFLVVLCTGIVCFRRYSIQGDKRQDYRTLNFQMNSVRSQQVQPIIASGNVGSDRAGHEIPTYSVFVGENDFNDDKPSSYDKTNPCVRL